MCSVCWLGPRAHTKGCLPAGALEIEVEVDLWAFPHLEKNPL